MPPGFLRKRHGSPSRPSSSGIARLGSYSPDASWIGSGSAGSGYAVSRCEAANAVAIDLYERLGFRVIGKRPGYYANGADAFVMAHALRGTDLLAPWASPTPIAVPPSKPALAPTTAPVPGLPKAAPIGAPAAAPRAVPIAAGCGVAPPH